MDDIDLALLAELQHRVRNTLGVVRSIARRSSETSSTVEEYAAHLDGRLSLQEAIDQTKARSRRFARRQMAWFRADPRVTWFTSDAPGAAAHLLAHRSPKRGEAA